MPVLELVDRSPNWFAALRDALGPRQRHGERRSGDDPWSPPPAGRPRRASDDLAWLREAVDDPDQHGLSAVDPAALVGVWHTRGADDSEERLRRLEERGVLRAAGFLLHEGEPVRA